MKKHLKYIIFGLTMFLLIGFTNIEAQKKYNPNISSLYCYYDGEYDQDIWCKVESSGAASCYFVDNYSTVSETVILKSSNISYNNFKSNDNYICPTVYVREVYIKNDDPNLPFSTATKEVELSNSRFDESDAGTTQSGFLFQLINYFELNNNEGKSYSSASSQDGNNNPNLDYINGCSDIPETITLIKQIYSFIRYLIPIIVIGLSIVDFLKVLLSGEEKVYKTAWSKFVKRIIIGIIILILPIILSFVINLSGVVENNQNIFCIFN